MHPDEEIHTTQSALSNLTSLLNGRESCNKAQSGLGKLTMSYIGIERVFGIALNVCKSSFSSSLQFSTDNAVSCKIFPLSLT